MTDAAFEIHDPRLAPLLVPGARLRRLWTGAEWTEGPVYVPAEDRLYFSDIPNDRVMGWSAADGISVALTPAAYANGHTVDRQGRIVRCEQGERRVVRVEPDGTRTTLADRHGTGRLNSPNDVIVAADGAVWFSDPPYGIISDREGHAAESEQPGCFVYRVDPAGGGPVRMTGDELEDPNGLALSPDESILYVSDTSIARRPDGRHHLMAYDVVDGGRRLTGAREFAVCDPGVFDGLRIDRDGNLWTSAGEGIDVYAPDGVRLGRLPLPETASNCTFAGTGPATLFITANRSLYAIEVATTSAVS